MTSASANANSSSKSSGKLKVEFFESGVGDTTLITFPSGGVGVVDAHPSRTNCRPDILKLVHGKAVHFVCLTHPHADHGVDLIPILEHHPQVESFWSTLFEIPAFIYGVEQIVNFPSPVQTFAAKMNQDWGEFLVDVFGSVIERRIPRTLLRSDLREFEIDGVEVHCLAPDQSVQNSFFDAYIKKLTDSNVEVPDPNSISAVLALKFGTAVVLLGGDALKRNWDSAVKHFRGRALPKACVLKVPHHGAKNSLNLKNSGVTYLDICSSSPKTKAVLFAGDAKHPHPDVYSRLRQRTDTFCLSNGTRSPMGANANPLRLQIPGARAVQTAPVCNPIVSFEVEPDGKVKVTEGSGCNACPRS